MPGDKTLKKFQLIGPCDSTLNVVVVFKSIIFKIIVAWALTLKLLSGECHRTPSMISQLPEPMFTQIYVAIQCSIQSAFLRDSVIHALKIPMTPKTESRGSKMTPCNFCGNLNILVPTSKTMIFLMILIIKSCENFWYRPIYCIQFWFAFIL